MTLLSPHSAVFESSSGSFIQFVDAPPGVIGTAYPFTVYVAFGGKVIDRAFAGFVWKAEGSLAGVSGPPYGNGQDTFTTVTGTMTLTSDGSALFRSNTGSQVQFVHELALGCD